MRDASKVSICNVTMASKAITKAVKPANTTITAAPKRDERSEGSREQAKANIYSWRAMPTFDIIFDI